MPDFNENPDKFKEWRSRIEPVDPSSFGVIIRKMGKVIDKNPITLYSNLESSPGWWLDRTGPNDFVIQTATGTDARAAGNRLVDARLIAEGNPTYGGIGAVALVGVGEPGRNDVDQLFMLSTDGQKTYITEYYEGSVPTPAELDRLADALDSAA